MDHLDNQDHRDHQVKRAPMDEMGTKVVKAHVVHLVSTVKMEQWVKMLQTESKVRRARQDQKELATIVHLRELHPAIKQFKPTLYKCKKSESISANPTELYNFAFVYSLIRLFTWMTYNKTIKIA